MSRFNKIIIMGYSGHSYVVLDAILANNYAVKGYFDFKEADMNPYNLQYLGTEDVGAFENSNKKDAIFPCVGSNIIREKLFNFLQTNQLLQISIIAPSAYISLKAGIGDSTFIAPNVVVNSMANIGNACIINSGAIVEHECIIGDYAHLAPGVVLAGNVIIGNRSFIGANTVIREGVKIGQNVIVGAGAVVVKDIPEGEIWMGNPAQKKS